MKDSAIIFGSIIISRIFVFLYRIIIIRELSVEDYALFALLTTVFFWIIIFCHFDLNTAISKYGSEFNVKNETLKTWKYYYNAILISIIFTIAGICIGLLLTYQQDVNIFVLIFFFISLFSYSITIINDGLIKAYKNFKQSAIISSNIGISRFVVVFIFLLIFTKISLEIVLILFSISFWILSFISFGLVSLQNKPKTKIKKAFKKNKTIMKRLINYSKWLTASDLFTMGNILIITYIIILFSLPDVAKFNVTMQIYGVFQMGFSAIVTVLIPQVSERAAKKEKIRLLGKKEFFYLSIITIIFLSVIAIIPKKEEIIIYVLGNETYANIVIYVIILLFSFPFRLFTIINFSILNGLGNTKVVAVVKSAGFFINIILIVPFYLIFGLIGAILALIIVFLVEFVLTHNYVNTIVRKHNLSVDRVSLSKIDESI